MPGNIHYATHQARHKTLVRVKELEQRIAHARDLVASAQIEPVDFREIKTACTATIEKLEAKLSALARETDLQGLLKKGLEQLLRLDYLYENGSNREKRLLIGSIFPDNLVFDDGRVRTARVNEVAHFIYQINSILGVKKTGQRAQKSSCPVRCS
ncbi:hypothetical protein [Pontibacter actiniarum]|uniref:Uncharacterized protein n=1 Tax=Pontibacter actiniarum TaxID=323450 RepID=A0A1X9YS60_9BACT|nr:hypothetical protein [Pontibacter actiniarum]ARS35698.1 hypothetical protein CA264_09740 [Pontibacter actiniarum]